MTLPERPPLPGQQTSCVSYACALVLDVQGVCAFESEVVREAFQSGDVGDASPPIKRDLRPWVFAHLGRERERESEGDDTARKDLRATSSSRVSGTSGVIIRYSSLKSRVHFAIQPPADDDVSPHTRRVHTADGSNTRSPVGGLGSKKEERPVGGCWFDMLSFSRTRSLDIQRARNKKIQANTNRNIYPTTSAEKMPCTAGYSSSGICSSLMCGLWNTT